LKTHQPLNSKFVTAILLSLMASAALTTPLLAAAQETPDVDILELTSANGAKDDTITLKGTLATSDGTYQLFLGGVLVASGKADGHNIYTNFTIPELPAALYELTLRDVRINKNCTGPFNVITGYTASASPSAIQEGESLTITVNLTGGVLGTIYGADISVVTPAGAAYNAKINLGTPNTKGTAHNSIDFPSSAFTPAGDTQLAGSYTIKINSTMGKSSFNVNMLDSITYHRGDKMEINAIGYEPNQAATITILSKQGTLDTLSVNADSHGAIKTSWVVPATAPMGEGTVRISVAGNPKGMAEILTFTIIGYNVNVTVTNLGGLPVPGITVQCIDVATDLVYNQTSDSSGQVFFNLGSGLNKLTAYWNQVNIGAADITVTGDGNYTLICQLTDLKITVKTEEGTTMPFVLLAISYQYKNGDASQVASVSGQTGGNGYYILPSTLTNAEYHIAASSYGEVFNSGNDTLTISNAKAITEVTIICPSANVSIGITGYNDQAIASARVELVELSNGLFYSATTDASGVVTVHATYGTYRLRVYKDDALIRETQLKVFDDTRRQIKCTLYGIQLTVSVVDFFGSPIPNAYVTINGQQKASAFTASNGKATFSNIVGGDLQVVAELQDTLDAFQAVTVTVNEPGDIEVRLEKYVFLSGALMLASTALTLIVILISAVLFIIIEVIRHKKAKSAPKHAA